MTYQAYLDTIKAKTGKTPADFRKLAERQGLTSYGAVMTWLKADFGLGHGHANVIAQLLVNADKLTATADDKLTAHFQGEKSRWRSAYDALAAKLTKLGPDVALKPNRSYINVQRGAKKIGIVQISSAQRIDLGLKLKGVAAQERLTRAGAWNTMVTHRIRVTDPKEIDRQVMAWFKQAYEAAA